MPLEVRKEHEQRGIIENLPREGSLPPRAISKGGCMSQLPSGCSMLMSMREEHECVACLVTAISLTDDFGRSKIRRTQCDGDESIISAGREKKKVSRMKSTHRHPSFVNP